MIDLPRALAGWRRSLGDAHVLTDDATLAAYGTATFATSARVLAVLRPSNTDEVRACLRVAQETGVPLHPTSGGKNWGYGSRVPVDHAAILDLARLDRILDYDERLATVTVEPGVTFRALHAFLRARRSPLYMSVPGTSPDASVLANAIERGDGAGPYGDRFAHAWAMEVVLPTGELVHTGFGRWSNAVATRAARWGVGPFLDGIFSQSSFGVVTRLTLGLSPLPARVDLALATLSDTARVPALVEGLRRLRQIGVARSMPALWNADKALALLGQYPFDATGGVTPLPDAVRARLLAATPFDRWNATVALPAFSDAQAAAQRTLVADVLGPVVDHLAFGGGAVDPEHLDELGPQVGVPHERSVASLYWRKRGPVPSEIAPERDGCGLVWVTPAVPCDGEAVRAAITIAGAEMEAHGFEPSLACVFADERVVYLMAGILFDRAVAGEDARALACHDRLLARFAERGLYPFRLGVQSMGALPPSDDDTDALLVRLKDALDPRHVLAPGRYEPRRK